jgi:hypothetical protein
LTDEYKTVTDKQQNCRSLRIGQRGQVHGLSWSFLQHAKVAVNNVVAQHLAENFVEWLHLRFRRSQSEEDRVVFRRRGSYAIVSAA